MPRFSIKDLLLATTMVAVGIGAALLAQQLAKSLEYPGAALAIAELGLWVGGSALAGAGVLYPFGRAVVGAAVGLVLSALWVGLLILAGVS